MSSGAVLMYVVFGLCFVVFDVWCYYYYILYIIHIHYTILIISYTILFFCSILLFLSLLPIYLLFFLFSSSLYNPPSSSHPFPSIFCSPIPPLLSSPPPSHISPLLSSFYSFPSFILYVSMVSYSYLYSINLQHSDPACFIGVDG